MNRDFKGVYISKEIWEKCADQSVSINEKCFLALINMGHTEKETEYYLKLGGIKNTSQIKWNLYKKGLYIPECKKINSPEDAMRFCIENSHEGLVCEWCGNECYVLHKHHFPISAKNGGTKIVRICPNCHSTYHSIFKEV